MIDGFTGDAALLPRLGQVWRTQVARRTHARGRADGPARPSEFRANGVVGNMDEFYAAFGVKEGDKLWRPAAERVKIW